ncbi:hypothetical protein GCM10010965_27480 [Caldalkalibacillus thermarum]|uniref:ParB/RepB/Spo0J family partition protein n=1 Tax=Caldalkalibacillus thermarum TaxID=296745 RepID=UPI00166DA488|nr:ParB N-terminal domain-containing protein [Caldalkalibacillus thermarum]GGK33152.1 hypothetical protein GCM10010965_27480 [Caldalkalibacillus thermarum]
MGKEKVVKNVPVESLRLHESVGIVPEMSLEEWEELLESIREKGIQVPVHALEDGRVLDGRHRLKAAKELGIREIDVIYHDMNDIEAIEFVRNTATKRRNLTPSQKAAIVLEAEDLCKKIAEAKRLNSLSNLKQGSRIPDVAQGPKGRTNEILGELAGVSGTTIKRVKKVKEKSPELFQKIKENKIAAKTAYKQVTGKNPKNESGNDDNKSSAPTLQPQDKKKQSEDGNVTSEYEKTTIGVDVKRLYHKKTEKEIKARRKELMGKDKKELVDLIMELENANQILGQKIYEQGQEIFALRGTMALYDNMFPGVTNDTLVNDETGAFNAGLFYRLRELLKWISNFERLENGYRNATPDAKETYRILFTEMEKAVNVIRKHTTIRRIK